MVTSVLGVTRSKGEQVVRLFRDYYKIPLVHADASALFLKALAGVIDPETKRKTIGGLFIDVFEQEAKKIGGAAFLAQGTLYPDMIESVSFTGGPLVTIKSHHDVGGLLARIINECRGINRVTHDITSKPPGTIEWE